MSKQHIAHADHAADDRVCNEDGAEFAVFSKAFADRRFGRSYANSRKGHTTWKAKKRGRVKAFSAIMQLRNMIRVGTTTDINSFAVVPDDAGNLGDHWQWPLLSLSPDCGADMVCMWAFLVFSCCMNVVANWDPAHMYSKY